ncbi:hypothetical protein [Methylobacterium sp. WSM2598]|uniref:hypothetical protein n=1 Tax=Methylobacterium sp. WSM2598 TaxID=398261 RepID=UPI0012F62B52|nr:hypothetical protein [Methylobacterium sp. WSM2598]
MLMITAALLTDAYRVHNLIMKQISPETARIDTVDGMNQSNEKIKLAVLLGLIAVGATNFIAFSIAAAFLGGDAGNGKIVNGHYFLGSHGTYTEVSEAVFTYSLWHVRSLFITHPLAGLAVLSLFKTKCSTSHGSTTEGPAFYVRIYGCLVRSIGRRFRRHL